MLRLTGLTNTTVPRPRSTAASKLAQSNARPATKPDDMDDATWEMIQLIQMED